MILVVGGKKVCLTYVNKESDYSEQGTSSTNNSRDQSDQTKQIPLRVVEEGLNVVIAITRKRTLLDGCVSYQQGVSETIGFLYGFQPGAFEFPLASISQAHFGGFLRILFDSASRTRYLFNLWNSIRGTALEEPHLKNMVFY